jgi:hypothetical protein
MIDSFFPEAQLLEKHKKHCDKQEIYKAVAEKFNGKVIMRLIPELKDKELGRFIEDYKRKFDTEEAFETVIMSLEQTVVNKDILWFYKSKFLKHDNG